MILWFYNSGFVRFHLETLLSSKTANLPVGTTVSCRNLSGPQPCSRSVCKGKFLWGWEEGKMKTLHMKNYCKRRKASRGEAWFEERKLKIQELDNIINFSKGELPHSASAQRFHSSFLKKKNRYLWKWCQWFSTPADKLWQIELLWFNTWLSQMFALLIGWKLLP